MSSPNQALPAKEIYKPWTFQMPPELFKSLTDESEKTGCPKAEILRRALRQYLARK
jgi:predicted DNA-binding protein